MKYISTRGGVSPVNFQQVVLDGLARDGGLYLPESIPDQSSQLSAWKNLSYQELAVKVISIFVDDEINSNLHNLIHKSYETFNVKEVTPLTFHENFALLELFHGPTLAFKDIALQFLGNLFEEILKNKNQQINILGATSGDTGSAAIYGVRGKSNITIFIIHPAGKVSKVQERQMTSVLDSNVHNIAIQGTFDDAQKIVKELFNNLNFRDQYNLASINSINWARVMAQIVYYFYAAFRFQEQYPKKDLIFSVPTGNFGDIYAGYVAKQLGLPIKKLILATNDNNILERTFKTGKYKIQNVIHTLSPSMDIQIASNFERLLYNMYQDGSVISKKMTELKQNGEFDIENNILAEQQKLFEAISISENQVLECIQTEYKNKVILDPHTAIGVAAAKQYTNEPVICLATAHPAKFPEAIQKAINNEAPVPERLKILLNNPTKCFQASSQKDIQSIIQSQN